MYQGNNQSEKGKRGCWVFIEDDCGGKKRRKTRENDKVEQGAGVIT